MARKRASFRSSSSVTRSTVVAARRPTIFMDMMVRTMTPVRAARTKRGLRLHGQFVGFFRPRPEEWVAHCEPGYPARGRSLRVLGSCQPFRASTIDRQRRRWVSSRRLQRLLEPRGQRGHPFVAVEGFEERIGDLGPHPLPGLLGAPDGQGRADRGAELADGVPHRVDPDRRAAKSTGARAVTTRGSAGGRGAARSRSRSR